MQNRGGLSLLLALLACLAVSVSAEGAPASRRRTTAQAKDGIHERITWRSTAGVLELFDRGVTPTVGGRKVNPLGELLLAMKGAVNGSKSLLSLGEGRSSFIYQLLGERRYFQALFPESRDALDNIHALDVSYPKLILNDVVEERQPDTGEVAGLDRYDARMIPIIREYPNNYHSGLFQEMNMIADASGRPIRFSMIVSTFSLSYVLLADGPLVGMKALMERVLAHLEPGGMLLMTPVPQSGAPADLDDRIAAYNALMHELRSTGAITDYNRITSNFRADKTPLVVIK